MNKILFLNSLKGCPLSIIFSILIFHGDSDVFFNESFFTKTTGYSSKTCREALAYLESINLIFRLSRYQGFKPSDYLLNLFSELLNTTATIEGTCFFSEENIKEEAEITARPVEITAVNNEVFIYLRDHSVGEPTRTILSKLPWATLDYVDAHFKFGQKNSDPLGLIIHRIRSQDPKPEIVSQIDLYYRGWGIKR